MLSTTLRKYLDEKNRQSELILHELLSLPRESYLVIKKIQEYLFY